MLNFNKIGRPLCKIEGGKYNNQIVSVSDKFNDNYDELIKEFRQLRISNDSKFQQIPDTTKEREILYIMGPSGSGKSTYTWKYLEQYKKKYKDRPIYLFSSLPEDESLDKMKPKRINLDNSMYEDPIPVDEFKDSVCIFDVFDVISNKKVREAVYAIPNNILEIGRHFRIHCICTNHLPTNGRETRRILNEDHVVVYFPHSAGGKIKYLLTEYVGVEKNNIAYFKRHNSRWCCIFKNYPQVYCTEHELGLLNTMDED